MDKLININLIKSKWIWILLISFETFLGYITILMPQYIMPVFIGMIGLVFLILWPEFSYTLAVLTLANRIFLISTTTSEHLPFVIKYIEAHHSNIKMIPFILNDIMLFTAFISCIIAKWAKAREPYPQTPIDLPVKLFFLWIALSSLWASSLKGLLIESVPLLGALFGFYLSVSLIRTKKMLTFTIGAFIFLGIINAVLAIASLRCDEYSFQVFQYNSFRLSFQWNTIPKVRGHGLSYTQCTAYFLNLSIILAVGLFLLAKGRKKIGILLIALLLTAGQLSTISKGGLLGLIAGLTFLYINYKPLKGYFLTAMVITFTTIVVLFPLVRFVEFGKNLSGVGRSIGGGSAETRAIIWNQTLSDMWNKTSGLGYGIGEMVPSHNIFLSVFFELGIIGFSIWLWLLAKFFYSIKIITSKPINPYYQTMLLCLASGMISTLCFGMVDMVYFDETLWMILGISMALFNLAKCSETLQIQKTPLQGRYAIVH